MSKNNLPKNYFKNLQSKIVEISLGLKDNIAENAPLLYKINKENIYTVPENYFINNVRNLSKQSNRKIRILPKRIIGIAASLLIMISVSWFTLDNMDNTAEVIAALDEEILIDYYLENTDEVDNSILADLDNVYDVESDLDFEELSDEELSQFYDSIIDDISTEDLAIINI